MLLNQSDKLDVGPALSEFQSFTAPLPPDLRGECLSNSALIRTTHNSFARAAPFAHEEKRPASDDDGEDLYHFIAYTPIHGTLYELDGLNAAPIAHGPCAFDDFPAAVIPVVQRRMQRFPAGEIRFALMAMVRDPRVAAAAIGDRETLARERKRRDAWMWENALRRHNFLGFTGELLRGVVKAKEKDGAYGAWVDEAKAATKKRVETRKKGGYAEDW